MELVVVPRYTCVCDPFVIDAVVAQVQALCDGGAQINAIDNEGYSPLARCASVSSLA